MATTSPARAASSARVDPRGMRFTAAITTVVVAVALVLVGTVAGTVLVAWSTLAFALGSLLGPQAHPYAVVFRTLLRPRLGPPAETEDARPPRFAHTVGLVFLTVALVGALTGLVALTYVALAFALAAAFLNAAFGFCLGCEMYLLLVRLRGRPGLA